MIENETTRAVGYHIRQAIQALGWYSRVGELSIDDALKSLSKAQKWLEDAKAERQTDKKE